MGCLADPQDFLLHLGHPRKTDRHRQIAARNHDASRLLPSRMNWEVGEVAHCQRGISDNDLQSFGRRSESAFWSIFTSAADWTNEY
jgi:hypothetical protein